VPSAACIAVAIIKPKVANSCADRAGALGSVAIRLSRAML
jgi:hypothetical protein